MFYLCIETRKRERRSWLRVDLDDSRGYELIHHAAVYLLKTTSWSEALETKWGFGYKPKTLEYTETW